MGEGELEPSGPSKKGRHRKKHLYNTILHQMEFYFSDSNLSKDRFLSKLMAEDPYIDLNIFMSFNKIRKLNCTLDDIKKAIGKSDLIELSEDKEKVCRKKPIVVKENIDDCTIYVENIKADTDHEWLRHFFSDFGNVVYVSIPKYKHTKGNKGFAFIEFEKETEAQSALSYFESIGCRMPSDTNPDELVSIKTFVADEKNAQEEGKPDESVSDVQTAPDPEVINEQLGTSKRKLSQHDDKPEKKRKLDCEDEVVDKKEDSMQVEESENENRKKKKHKKDKKKNISRDLGLKILSKREWKKLRNRYLDLQRKKMKEFKQYLHKQKGNVVKEERIKEEPIKEEHNEESDETLPKEPSATQEFVPGVIVKITLPKPCPDAKRLKNEIKDLSSDIKYVDIPLPAGSEEIYVRFSNSESAKEFCNQTGIGSKAVLEDDEEKKYWEKIQNDRTVKLSKNVKKQRGRDKLLKKAGKLRAQHLRFDDGE